MTKKFLPTLLPGKTISIDKAETTTKKKQTILKLDTTLKDDDLPYVSIITPTYERRKLFSIALHNFYNFYYTQNKLEWIIVDVIDSKKIGHLKKIILKILYLKILELNILKYHLKMVKQQLEKKKLRSE